MNIKNGDKLIFKKDINGFNKGYVVTVSNLKIKRDFISFDCNDGYALTLPIVAVDTLFDKVQATTTVTKERIEEIMTKSNIVVDTVFGKCTVVSCRLPNGFVIVESSACVDPDNYDEDMGVEICLDRIENKIWELEGYRLQEELHRQNNDDDNNGCPYGGSVDCNYCDNDDCDWDDDDEDDDNDDCEDNVYFCRCCGCH